jgi:hypothetical protein
VQIVGFINCKSRTRYRNENEYVFPETSINIYQSSTRYTQEDIILPFITRLKCGSKSFTIEHYDNLRQQLNEPLVRKSHSIALFEFTVNTFEVLKPTGNLLSSLSILSNKLLYMFSNLLLTIQENYYGVSYIGRNCWCSPTVLRKYCNILCTVYRMKINLYNQLHMHKLCPSDVSQSAACFGTSHVPSSGSPLSSKRSALKMIRCLASE